jgi:hypothetical protein
MHYEEWKTKEQKHEGKHVSPQWQSKKYISIVGNLGEN